MLVSDIDGSRSHNERRLVQMALEMSVVYVHFRPNARRGGDQAFDSTDLLSDCRLCNVLHRPMMAAMYMDSRHDRFRCSH